MLTKEIINKFNVEGPRYTSYPTAPVWTDGYTHSNYHSTLKLLSSKNTPLSLYIHIPFCEKRCYFCACNVVIKKQKTEFGDTYLDYLEKEIWHHSSDLETHTVETHIYRLRKKILKVFKDKNFIISKKNGYQIN